MNRLSRAFIRFVPGLNFFFNAPIRLYHMIYLVGIGVPMVYGIGYIQRKIFIKEFMRKQ
jgi:hypothetical protein